MGHGPKSHRYVHDAPGDLVHVDIKKLGRIPDGGGWRIHGRGSAQDRRATVARDQAARAGASPSRGYAYLHHAVDDHSRLAYSEILADERKETAVGVLATRPRLLRRATASPCSAVLTDNGSCYRSKLWAKTLAGQRIKHRRTRPYRPQTNGKVERFNRTLLEEWAYARRVPLRSRTRSQPTRPGSTSTITTAATPHSTASHPSTSCPTCPDRTPRSHRSRFK